MSRLEARSCRSATGIEVIAAWRAPYNSADAICRFMAGRGFESCDRDGVSAVHALARGLIPGEIAAISVLSAVQEDTGSSIFLKRENGLSVGFFAFFALSGAGESAIRSGVFSGVRVDRAWVRRPAPGMRAGYFWAFGGLERSSKLAVLRAALQLRDEVFPHLRIYARAATDEGRRIMIAMKAQPVCPADPALFVSPPREWAVENAA